MTKRHFFRGAAPAQKMAGMLIEQIDTELVALYRRAAEMRGHLKSRMRRSFYDHLLSVC